MSVAETSFLVGNIIMACGTLLLIHSVIKNKNQLKSYNLIGATLTFISLLFLLNGYIALSQFGSFIFVLINVIYWGAIVTFKLTSLNKNKEEKK